MKTINTIITALIFSLTAIIYTASASNIAVSDTIKTERTYSELNTSKIETALISGLSSDVYGVVESSLFNIMEFKITYPDFESAKVETQLRKIVAEASSHTLRFKAFLTLTYLRNQDSFESPGMLAEMLDRRDQNKIFYQLQSAVQSEQFTVSN